jgi:hypothetical protein
MIFMEKTWNGMGNSWEPMGFIDIFNEAKTTF